MKKIKSLVIGLGQSGFDLDLDPKRKIIWTHCKAINKHKNLDLCGAIDSDHSKGFHIKKKFKDKVLFSSNLEECLNEIKPEFISICTPTNTHLDLVKKLSKFKGIKYIFCEKPLGTNTKEAQEIISLCKESKIILATNYMRRWDKKYLWIKDKIESKSLGNLISINAYGTTAMYTSSSHLMDLILFYGGSAEKVSGYIQEDFIRKVHGEEDPGANAFIKFSNGVTCHLIAKSKTPNHYMFEIDLIFQEGRIVIKNDGKYLKFYTFKKTDFSGTGYLGLSEKKFNIKDNERMLDAITDIINCEFGESLPKSSGKNALDVHKLIRAINKSSLKNGSFCKI
tara:strand:- start:9637 stop:10650 length:1014 start_codon:yes stop_codon:yes gene_type:complete